MANERHQRATALLVLAVVVGFGMSVGFAALVGAYHTGTTEKAQATIPAGLATQATAFLHPGVSASAKIHKATSANWAGYADLAKTAGTITQVFAEWTVPTVTCNEPTGYAWQAQWIGIDGANNGNVSQVGSIAYCSAPGATPAYYDWYEFYPYEGVQFVAPTGAGAFITAYVLYNPNEEVNGVVGVYALELYDADFGVNFVETGGGWVCSGTLCEGGPDADAECISEAPVVGVGISPVADYSTTTFLGCHATFGTSVYGIGALPSKDGSIDRFNQVGASTLTDQVTGALSTFAYKDDSFTITWTYWD